MNPETFDRRLLEAISRVHAGFLQSANARLAFADLLAALLDLTGSEYGFIGEVLHDPDGAPYLKTHAITNIAWDDATRALYRDNADTGLDFRKLESLFGRVITTRAAVIANQPATDPRRGGLPPGHPPLDRFMGLPCFGGGQMLGMIGVANRADGYDDVLACRLEPLLATCANLLLAHRTLREREDAADKLRDSEARLLLALHAGRLGTWEFDLATGAIRWSTGVEALYGLPPGRFGGTLDAFLALIHPEDRASISAAIERRLADPDGDLFEVEHRVLSDGDVRWLSGQGRVVRDSSGRPVRMLGTVADVTRDKAMTARLMQADRLSAIGTLAAAVGHEINNPLTFVQGNLRLAAQELSRMRAVLDGGGASFLNDVLEMLDEAEIGVGRIAAIVQQLRTFARADVRPQSLDVGAVVHSALRMAENQLRYRAQLIVELPPLPPVVGQEGPLAQVFLNLLLNAMQAFGEGEREGERNEIRVTGTADGDWVVISIGDTGAGIPSDVMPKIFDPFFTTKPIGEGTGLGLAISRQIIASHRGELRVYSQVGVGTRFDVVLPRSGDPEAPEIAKVTSIAASGPVRILVIDDEPMVVRVLVRLLEPRLAVGVTSASAALTRLEAGEDYDVLLCDLVMPGMTGMELYAELCRSRPELAERCLFMSGGAFTPEARDFVEAPHRKCLDKPIDAAILQVAVDQIVARRRPAGPA